MLDLVEIVKNASINSTWHISILSYSLKCRGVKVPLDHKLLRHFVQHYGGKIEGELFLFLITSIVIMVEYMHVHLLYDRRV